MERLKQIIEESLPEERGTEVIPMNILNKREFLSRVDQYREKHNLLAVVSTVDLKLNGIPFIAAAEILEGSGIEHIKSIIGHEEDYFKIGKSMKPHLKHVDSEKLIRDTRYIISLLEKDLKIQLRNEVNTGIILHISFMVDKLKGGGKETLFRDYEEYHKAYSRELELVKENLSILGKYYDITIGENEAAYVCRMFTANDESVQAQV